MKKKIIGLLICAVTVAGVVPTCASAEEMLYGSADGFDYKNLDANTVQVVGFNKKEADMIVPQTLNGKTVVSIAFDYSNFGGEVKNVVLPDTVKRIEEHSFYCSYIESIDLGGVEEIADCAFTNSRRLKTVKFPDTLKTIGYKAFQDCRRLTGIALPNTLEAVGSSAFEGCKTIENVNLPEGITELGRYTFSGCEALKTVSLPESLESIGAGAFYGCRALAEIYIPKNVSKIDMPFGGETNLEQMLIDGENPSYTVKDTAVLSKDGKTFCFTYKPTGRSYTVPEGVKTIGKRAFARNDKLRSVTLPKGLKVIDKYAFYRNERFKEINFPKGLKEIRRGAFAYTALRKVKFSDTVEIIGAGAFRGCEIEKVTLPKNLKKIYASAFFNNEIEKVTIPAKVRNINNEAFGYNEIEKLTVLSKKLKIGKYAFAHNGDLKTVRFPGKVTIGKESFGYAETYPRRKIKNFAIYGKRRSGAQRYARKYGFKFIAI